MMTESRNHTRKRVFNKMLMTIMIVGGVVMARPFSDVKAAVTRNTCLDLVTDGNSNDESKWTTEKWKWDTENNTLTLGDGFELSPSSDVKPAMTLRAGTTIVLEGSATIISDQKGIETNGDLTIKSAEGKKGYLKIKINKDAPNGYLYYGIEIKNDKGTAERKLTVTNHSILEVDSTGSSTSNRNGSILCSAVKQADGTTIPSNTKASLVITDQSVVQLRNATSVAQGFNLKSPGRILYIKNGTDPSLLKESVVTDITSEKNITMMTCAIEGAYDNEAVTTYSLTYDGKDHPVIFNTEDEDAGKATTYDDDDTVDGRLEKLGTPILPIIIKPVNFDYYESKNSEFLNNGSDYREKDVVKTTTQYTNFKSSARGTLINAATYHITYNGTDIANLKINQREIEITGLKAKDKTYDGWPDAEIDYSEITYICKNDFNKYDESGKVKSDKLANSITKAIVDTDTTKIGTDIVPYAKAYFIATDGDGADVRNPFSDNVDYKLSKNVAYDGEGTSAQNTVAAKTVYIDNGKIDDGTAEGLPTGITLGDPNYKVMTPSATNAKKSQIKTEKVKIYPRSLNEDSKDIKETKYISYKLIPNKVKWRESGYLEGTDIVESITDISPKTPNNQGEKFTVTLEKNKDYIVNPNNIKVTEVGEYEIKITGCGNYTGTIKPKWSIERAVREITIVEPDTKAYDKKAYVIAANNGTGDAAAFNYKIEDVSNNKNVTDNLEAGSNLSITYIGRNSTAYTESETAPTEAGDYTVKVKVAQTERYTAAEKTLDYTIYPKTVSLDWTCEGGQLDATVNDPETYIYNGTPNVFSAKVNNAFEGDEVNVLGVVYKKGTADLTDAPKNVGSYSVSATGLSNPNYTVAATNANATATAAHIYVISQATVKVSWDVSGSPYTYDATNHTPTSKVLDLCKNSEGKEDVVTVTAWSFTGDDGNSIVDSLGNEYVQANGAVNASSSDITITATALSDSNYKLADASNCSAKFKILPCDLTTLKIGTPDDHADAQIYAAKQYYTGKIEEPEIMWVSGEGVKELQNFTEGKVTDYTKYSDEAKAKLVDGYTASLATQSLEYNNVDEGRGMDILITGRNNFTGEIKLKWNVDKIDSDDLSSKVEIKLNNYPDTITYGASCPVVSLDVDSNKPYITYENEDIKKDLDKGLAPYVSYLFTGTEKNGTNYKSKDAPTQAGQYTITVILDETEHYKSVEDSHKFTIAQKEVELSGITAVDKEYDGTKTATLDFRNSSWTGVGDDISTEDKNAITEALAGEQPDKGYVSYKAEFADKDVKYGNNAHTIIEAQDVSISDLAINEELNETAKILYNFKIDADGSQKKVSNVKILPKEISVSGVKAYDKVYNGSKEAVLDFREMKIDGKVSKKKDNGEDVIDEKGNVVMEEIDVDIVGEYTADGTPDGKDVKLDENNNPTEKKINLKYNNSSITTADKDVITYNYKIKDDSQKELKSIIKPATLTIKGLKAVDRVYDGTTKVDLDWSNTSVEGACTVDVINVNKEANGAEDARAKGNFATADVAYNKNNKVIEKTGTIKNSEYTVVLTGNHRRDNYIVADVTFTGTIMPKKLNGIVWSYDEKTLADLPENSRYVCGSSYAIDNAKLALIPKANLDDDCGLVGDDKCETVVKYYNKADDTFANAIKESEIEIETETVDENTNKKSTNKTKLDPRLYTPLNYLEDNGEYVAKVVSVTNGNYVVDDTDEHITYAFGFDADSDASELVITNYQKTGDGKVFAVTYGDELPKVTFTYNNTDIAGESESAKASHFTYLYTGKALNGDSYEDSKPPVNAGSYKVTVTLEETAHFKSSTAQAAFVIEPRTITILQGVFVEDKIYNGTDKATLNFKKVVFDDVIAKDEEEFEEIFSNGKFIQYNANFASKNVYYAEDVIADGETENKVSGQDVKVNDYSFIYNESTPAVLYNYTLAKEGNVSLLNGKIIPKAVKITGVKAKDRVYDGTDKVIFNTAKAEFAGKLKGDSLGVEASGSYQVTGDEESPSDVLMDEKGVVSAKNITIEKLKLVATNENTVVENYIVDESSYNDAVSAKILPRAITIKKGLKAKDKVYNASTVAAIDFSEVTFNDVIGDDGNTLKDLLKGEDSKHIAYKADFASKDVAYDTPEGGEKTIAEMDVVANDYYFVIDETTPQIMKNYMIKDEGNQTELKGKITPKPVKIKGIAAKDKTYDGTDKAEFDISNVEFDGKFKGDLLDVEVSGNFDITSGEANASDVVLDSEGVVASKDVTIDDLKLVAGDETTIVDNYVLSDDTNAETIKLQAKINPKELVVKEGLKVKDKLYDGSTNAVLDFKDVVFDGFVGEDDKQLKKLIADEAGEYVTYKANFASKDVAYDTSDTNNKKVTDMAVKVTECGFAVNETTPQIIKNYVIGVDGVKSGLKGKISPCAITVSGIKAKDKTYDGTDVATLDLKDISFKGNVEGESLKVNVKGAFIKTDKENAAEVLYTAKGEVGAKKVALVISDLAAANGTTNIANYYLAKDGQQTETTAVINPIEITPTKWSVDENTHLPVVQVDEKDESKTVVKYYEESDKEFKNPIAADKLVAGNKYVARIEGYNDSNYHVANEYKAVTYTFTYTKNEEKPVAPVEEAPSAKVMADTVLALDENLLVSAKGNKLTFKWGQASEADGYNVYTTTKKGKYGEPIKLAGVNSHTYKIKNQKKTYYMYVEAFKIVNGQETVLGKSKELVWSGNKTKGVNAKAVKVSKKKLNVAVNKKVSVKASITVTKKVGKVTKTQTIKGKKAGLKYWSTDKKIATVSSKGKIKGKKAGTCYIYVMAKDGKKQKIQVTVK